MKITKRAWRRSTWGRVEGVDLAVSFRDAEIWMVESSRGAYRFSLCFGYRHTLGFSEKYPWGDNMCSEWL